MLKRFSLYGFLKNQQYYEPFLILAFRQMGLSFFMIGLLVAFREVIVNIIEVPSGAIADLAGKRHSMILSFSAYIISFTVLGLVGLALIPESGARSANPLHYLFLLVAIFFLALGDAFRTGTHKAMIFTWLRSQNRESERTRVYGYTRSWSKIGSAVSVLLATGFVFFTNNYIYIFFFSIIPYLLNIINFMGYPAYLDGQVKHKLTSNDIISHLKRTISLSYQKPQLRRLIIESMGFEGFFKATKDYLQPVIKITAISLFATQADTWQLSEIQRTSLLIGPVFFVLFLLSALASRKAYLLAERHDDENTTARTLWGIQVGLFVLLTPAFYYGYQWIIIAGFIVLYIMQNLWRPVLITRFDAISDETQGATILSIESQAKSLATMVFAPSIGFAVDWVSTHGYIGSSGGEFWPIGLLGFLLALGFFLSGNQTGQKS